MKIPSCTHLHTLLIKIMLENMKGLGSLCTTSEVHILGLVDLNCCLCGFCCYAVKSLQTGGCFEAFTRESCSSRWLEGN
jgi:hypothetical protein